MTESTAGSEWPHALSCAVTERSLDWRKTAARWATAPEITYKINKFVYIIIFLKAKLAAMILTPALATTVGHPRADAS